MLVDLARNDLGSVCEYGSVHVNELLQIERYSHVMHIVSDVIGTLRAIATRSTFSRRRFRPEPLRERRRFARCSSMDELEPVARGFYAGSVGRWDLAGISTRALRCAACTFARSHRLAGLRRHRRRLVPEPNTTKSCTRRASSRDVLGGRRCGEPCSSWTTWTPSPTTSCTCSRWPARAVTSCATTNRVSGRRCSTHTTRWSSGRGLAAAGMRRSAGAAAAPRRRRNMPVLGVCLGHPGDRRSLRRRRLTHAPASCTAKSRRSARRHRPVCGAAARLRRRATIRSVLDPARCRTACGSPRAATTASSRASTRRPSTAYSFIPNSSHRARPTLDRELSSWLNARRSCAA